MASRSLESALPQAAVSDQLRRVSGEHRDVLEGGVKTLEARVLRREHDFNVLLGKHEHLCRLLRDRGVVDVPAEERPKWSHAVEASASWLGSLSWKDAPSSAASEARPAKDEDATAEEVHRLRTRLQELEQSALSDPRQALLSSFAALGVPDLPALQALQRQNKELEEEKEMCCSEMDALCRKYAGLYAELLQAQSLKRHKSPSKAPAETPDKPSAKKAKKEEGGSEAKVGELSSALDAKTEELRKQARELQTEALEVFSALLASKELQLGVAKRAVARLEDSAAAARPAGAQGPPPPEPKAQGPAAPAEAKGSGRVTTSRSEPLAKAEAGEAVRQAKSETAVRDAPSPDCVVLSD